MTQHAAAKPLCDHHWVSHFQPDIPKIIGWVAVCSQCGCINGAELCAALATLAEPRQAPTVPAVRDDVVTVEGVQYHDPLAGPPPASASSSGRMYP